MQTIAYVERVTIDTLVHNGPCILYAARPHVETSYQVITIYDGQDASAGKIVDYFAPVKGADIPMVYGPGVYLEHGLYVDIGTAGDMCTVIWAPAPALDLG